MSTSDIQNKWQFKASHSRSQVYQLSPKSVNDKHSYIAKRFNPDKSSIVNFKYCFAYYAKYIATVQPHDEVEVVIALEILNGSMKK